MPKTPRSLKGQKIDFIPKNCANAVFTGKDQPLPRCFRGSDPPPPDPPATPGRPRPSPQPQSTRSSRAGLLHSSRPAARAAAGRGSRGAGGSLGDPREHQSVLQAAPLSPGALPAGTGQAARTGRPRGSSAGAPGPRPSPGSQRRSDPRPEPSWSLRPGWVDVPGVLPAFLAGDLGSVACRGQRPVPPTPSEALCPCLC